MLAGLEVLILRDEFRQSYVPTELVGIGIVGLAELLDLARPDLKVLLVVCQCLFCLLGAKPMKTYIRCQLALLFLRRRSFLLYLRDR